MADDEVEAQRRLAEQWHTLTPTRRAALAAHDESVRAAERERIVSAIEAERDEADTENPSSDECAAYAAYRHAARIARGNA